MYAKIPNTEVKAENGESVLFHDTKGIPRTQDEMKWALEVGYVIPAFRNGSVDVEKLLDYVDVKLDWYIPSEEAFNVINFIRLSMGREPENLNSKAHYFFIDAMLGSEEIKPYYTVRGMDFDDMVGNALILSTREFSKSVLVTFFILYIAYTGKKKGFGRVNLLLYVSDRMEGNVKATMRTIKGLVKKSTFLSEAFEETYFTDANVRLIRHPRSPKEIKAFRKGIEEGKSLDQIMFRGQRTFTLQGVGSSGGRGSRDEDLARPDGVVFDDLIANERDAFSKAILESIESTITADVGSSLSGNKSFQIFIGTAYHTNDPIYKRAGNGTVLPVVFPRAEVAPHGDIYDKDGNLVKKALTKEEFISVWDDRHGFEKQRKAYREAEKALAAGDSKLIRTRNQEYYVRVVSASDRLIPEESIKFKNCLDVILNAKDYTWFVTTDYTTSKAVGSDLSGAALWARDYLGNTYLMELSLHLKSIEEQYDDTLNFVKKATGWGARWVDVGVEIDGQQAAHLYGLRKRADERSIPLYLAKQIDPQGTGVTWEGIRSKGSGDKLWRLKLIEPEYSSNRMYYNETLKYSEDLDELLRELSLTTNLEIKSKHDDGLDLLSQLALIQQWHELPNKPISETLESNVYNKEFKDIQKIHDEDLRYTIDY